MKIINASPKHLEVVYRLICELEDAKIDREDFAQVYLDNINNHDVYYLLAVKEDDVVGFASLHVQKLLHHCAKIGEIQEIIIDRKQQGLGIGSMLFNKIVEIAESNECLQLEVCCSIARELSHKFYLNHGMEKSHYKFTRAINTEG